MNDEWDELEKNLKPGDLIEVHYVSSGHYWVNEVNGKRFFALFEKCPHPGRIDFIMLMDGCCRKTHNYISRHFVVTKL